MHTMIYNEDYQARSRKGANEAGGWRNWQRREIKRLAGAMSSEKTYK